MRAVAKHITINNRLEILVILRAIRVIYMWAVLKHKQLIRNIINTISNNRNMAPSRNKYHSAHFLLLFQSIYILNCILQLLCMLQLL